MLFHPRDPADTAARGLLTAWPPDSLPSHGALVRTELLERLSEQDHSLSHPAAITLVRAPAGHRKTSTVSAWLGDPAENRALWMRCTPGDDATLWERIADSLAAQPETDESAPSSAAKGLPDPRCRATDLAARLTGPITLVIDDYHHATTADNDLALIELHSASPLLTLVVVGRRVRVLDGPLTTGRVRVFGPRELALTPAEALELAHLMGAAESESLHAALEQADGWPLAVRAATQPGDGDAPGDPLAALSRFALHHLEIVDNASRRLLLAAAQLDAIDLEQAAEFIAGTVPEARAAAHRLIELGVLVAAPGRDSTGSGGTEFRCHRAVQAPLANRARRSTLETRRELLRGRGARIEQADPLTAFKHYCTAEAYAEAELVLARNLTVFLDEDDTIVAALRPLPESMLIAHPTFAAAQLMTAMPHPSTSPTSIAHLVAIWHRGLHHHLVDNPSDIPDEMRLPLLVQAMVATRLTGRIDRAHELASEVEARLGAARAGDMSAGAADPAGFAIGSPAFASPGSSAGVSLRRSMPTFYRELASTALMAGDLAQARRNWQLLRAHAESLIETKWSGSAQHASARTGAGLPDDAETGRRWLLAALNGMALTDLVDGDLNRSAELLAQAEALESSTGTRAPGLSWVGGEITRAHLSYERRDESLMHEAHGRLARFGDRIEQWPLLLIAEAASVRYLRGADWALSHLIAGIRSIDEGHRMAGRWRDYLSTYEAMLHTVLGDFEVSDRILAGFPSQDPVAQVERARRALFSGDDVTALLIGQSVGDAGATKRQQLDRCLICAVSAWRCGKREEALASIANAARLLRECGLPSMLWSVPYDPLLEIASAAREAGVCDIVALVEDVPETARCRHYERLTEMELRTLAAIAEHRSTGQAAAALFITQGTVKKHLASVYRKLHAKGRDEAILQATRMGLLSANSGEHRDPAA